MILSASYDFQELPKAVFRLLHALIPVPLPEGERVLIWVGVIGVFKVMVDRGDYRLMLYCVQIVGVVSGKMGCMIDAIQTELVQLSFEYSAKG